MVCDFFRLLLRNHLSPDELLIAIGGQWWIHMEVYELPCC